MSSSHVFGVGVIGAGLIGNKRAEAVRQLAMGRILGVADVDREKASTFADKFGCPSYSDPQELLKSRDVEIVIVATVNKFLAPLSCSALDQGKHVLCEKPLGRNADESREIVTCAARNKVVLKTGFNHRHHPAVWKAKQLVDEGRLGPLYFLRCSYGHGGRSGYEKEWRADKDLCGGGELLDQGVHVVDLFRWFAGDFEEVFGVLPTYYWDMKVEDNAFAVLRTPKKQTAVMHTSWTQWKNKFRFEIFGEKGYLAVDGLGGSYGMEKLVVGKRRVSAESGHPIYLSGPPDEEVIEFPGPDISWMEEWKEFVQAIVGKRVPCGSGYDGLMANRLIDAVYRSARINSPVKVGNED
ncbi:MAG: Gfo/Idh/MocA family oxidoreductase [Candidatus Aminicenantes bacterium]|nr:Gfo/Idh/MocA family oxidoreductase [Candidatus Aminicenantes bacterium]